MNTTTIDRRPQYARRIGSLATTRPPYPSERLESWRRKYARVPLEMKLAVCK